MRPVGNLFETDRFTQSFDVSDAATAYVARLDGGTGEILIAQTILAIDEDGKGRVKQVSLPATLARETCKIDGTTATPVISATPATARHTNHSAGTCHCVQFETSWGFKAIGDIAISSSGHVYVGGVVSAGLHGHSQLTVNGKRVGS